MNSEILNEALMIPPSEWTKRHLEALPKQYLLKNVSAITLHEIWQNLSEGLKQDSELQSHLPCLEHYNRDEDQVHIDGPPPPKYRCRVCKRREH